MTYTPYLISAFITGFDQELQPWLLPDDAQDTLFDGFVYRGVWQKRAGYSQFATGQRGGAPYCESRMIHTVTVSANEAADGIRTSFTFNVAGTTKPLRRGGFRALDKNAATPPVTIQIIQDDGIGGTLAGSNGTITTVLNYTTTLATPQGVTFSVAPAAGHTVTLQLDVHQGFAVMGVMNFYTESNSRELIVADTTYVNRYNPATNRLDDISPVVPLSGNTHNFMSWVNYSAPNTDVRLLFVNGKNPIQRYDGTTVKPYPVYTALGTPLVAQAYATGNGTPGPYVWATPVAVYPGSVTIKTAGKADVKDDLFGNLVGTDVSSGSIDYLTGITTLTYTSNVPGAQAITIDYTPLEKPINTALLIFQMKDRLVVVQPTQGGDLKGKRILISGTGAYGDMFVPEATGAGLIDVPDDSFLNSGDFNRDDLLLFTKRSTWILKYTGNDSVPFELNKIDNTRGTLSPYGTITYLNTTTGQSPIGFIGCDGYSVERTDDKIPRYSFDNIDQENFDLCFAGTVDDDRDHYLIHPSPSKSASDRILVTNYEEFNYSVYRLPLSCMGEFFITQGITWDDLSIYKSWEEMSEIYGTWNSFAYQKATPISIGGGHHGQIVQLNNTETEDYPVKIRGITGTAFNLTVTTDYQDYKAGDYIYLQSIQGAVELNGKQGTITSIIDNYNFVMALDTQSNFTPSAYTANSGVASSVINFQSTTKKFNPFSNVDKKVRCGWLYVYASTTGTNLTDSAGDPVPAILKIRVLTNDNNPGDFTELNVPNQNYYEVNLSNPSTENGVKKWSKIWINQTARFIQFQIANNQAGAKVEVHALMPGFAPVGRMV